MVNINNFTGGMGAHSVLLAEGQVAYSENVDLRNPERVTLGQKSTNVCSTGTDLALCAYGTPSAAYFGTDGGEIYKQDGTSVATITGNGGVALAVYQLVNQGGDKLYIAAAVNGSNVNNFVINSISLSQITASSDWTSETSWATSTSKYMRKYIKQGTDIIYASSSTTKKISSGTFSDLGSFGETLMSLWKNGQDVKAVGANGTLFFLNQTAKNSIFSYTASGLMLDGNSLEGMDFIIGGGSPDGSVMYVPNGLGKSIIGKAYTDLSCESKEKFHFGRTSQVFSDSFPTYSVGNDVFASFNNITYAINKDKVLSRGNHYGGLPVAFNYEITTNSAGDTLTEIGFVKLLEDNVNAYLYYGWKNDSGDCGVDRIDVTAHVPSSFRSEGTIYTKKFVFGPDRVHVNKMRLRAKTTANQTIKVYDSVDGGDYNLVATLNGSDPKEYHLVSYGKMAREVQFKFVMETTDSSATPELYSFSFEPEGYDN